MNVEEYINVAKDEFPYLFNNYGFELAFSLQEKTWRFAFGIESKVYQMRMLFSRQQGAGTIYLGPNLAPFNNEYSDLYWFTMGNILIYLDRKRIDWSQLDRFKGDDRIRPVFRFISKKFASHCPSVFRMFSSEAEIASWRPEFEQYIEEAFKEQNEDTVI